MGVKERKKREKETRRREILDAARNVFAGKGLKKTTMEEIAREAELSPGTLYLYFKNKDELIASLSTSVLEYLRDQLRELNLRKELDPHAKLYFLKQTLFHVYEFDSLLLINIFNLQSGDNLKNLSSEMLEVLKELSRSSINEIAKIFEQGIEAGCFIEKHPMALADITWSLFSGVVLWEDSKKLLDSEKDFLKQTFETAFEVLIRGVVKEMSEAGNALREGRFDWNNR